MRLHLVSLTWRSASEVAQNPLHNFTQPNAQTGELPRIRSLPESGARSERTIIAEERERASPILSCSAGAGNAIVEVGKFGSPLGF